MLKNVPFFTAKKIVVRIDDVVKNQFNSLLLCLNEEKCILLFAFLPNQSLNDVKEALLNLGKRTGVKRGFSDKCHDDAKALKEAFGEEVDEWWTCMINCFD